MLQTSGLNEEHRNIQYSMGGNKNEIDFVLVKLT